MSTLTPLQPMPSLLGKSPQSGQGFSSDGNARNQLQGEVIKNLGGDRFLIDIGGKQIEMHSQTPLAVGQQLRLAIAKTEPLQLRIVPESTESKQQGATTTFLASSQIVPTQLLTHASSLAGKPIDLGTLFTLLSTANSSASPLSGETLTVIANFFSLQQNFLQNKTESGTILQQLIEHLGLSHEKNIQNGQSTTASNQLKNSLLELLNLFPKSSTTGQEASRLSGIIEFFQLTNIALPGSNEQIFPIPLPFVDQGFLRVYHDQSAEQDSEANDNDQQQLRYSLYLKMSNIGNLQIDFTGNMEGIYLHIHAESIEQQQFLEQYSKELETTLSSNRSLRGIRFSHDAKEPAGELLRLALHENQGLLNTKA